MCPMLSTMLIINHKSHLSLHSLGIGESLLSWLHSYIIDGEGGKSLHYKYDPMGKC